jgi:hypothetical protein
LSDVDTIADLQALADGPSRTAAWVRASGIPPSPARPDKLKG